MTLTVEDQGHGVLALAGTDIVSASSSTVVRVTHCTFFNAHTSGVTVTVYYLQSGEVVGDSGTFKAERQIAPRATWICTEVIGQNVTGSAELHAVPSVTNVVHYNVSGDIIS